MTLLAIVTAFYAGILLGCWWARECSAWWHRHIVDDFPYEPEAF